MILFTSTLFGTNAAHALIRGAWIYAAAFAALTVTSWWYHYSGNYDDPYAFLYDQCAILAVVLIGLYYSWRLPTHLLWLAFALFVFVFIAYQFECNHSLIQLLCMASHHCIMAGI